MRGLERHAALLASGGEIVCASARQAEALRHELARARAATGDTVWESPRILPYGAWLERAAHALEDRPQLLAPGTTSRLWRRLVADSPAGGELISAGAAAADAERAFGLLAEWRLSADALDTATPERAAFRGWARSFGEECRRQRCIDRARLPELLLKHAAAAFGVIRPLGWHGFARMTPLRRALDAALHELGRETHELTLEAGPARAEFATATTPEHELELIADWAAASLARDPGARLGVLLPELGGVTAAFARVLDDRLAPARKSPGAPDARPYTLGRGPRLGEQALAAGALAVLALADEPIDVPTLGRVLRSPYLAPPGEPEDAAARASLWARLDARVRALGARELPASELLKLLRGSGAAAAALVTAIVEIRRVLAVARAQSTAAWAELFPRALRAAGWPFGRALGASESLAAHEFYAALERFAALTRVLPPLPLAAARAEFAALLSDSAFVPEPAAAPLRVLDGLEDAALPFDALWVAGLTVERFPLSADPNPFLPAALQREQGMPRASAELALAEAAATLAGWQRSAPELVLSAPSRDGDATLLRSGLVPELPAYAGPAPGIARAATIHAAGRRVAWHDGTLPAIAPGVALAGGVRVLELQSACPFRAGAELRLAAQPLEQPSPGIPRRVRGTLVHQALRNLWDGLGSRAALEALAPEGRRLRAIGAVDAALGGYLGYLPRGMLRELEKRWMVKAVLALAEYELKRAPFQVLALEQRDEVTLAGHTLATRLDRLDRLGDGGTVLIDYKSGGSAPRRWSGERPEVMQLAAYAAFRDPPPQALVLARLKLSQDHKFVGRAASARLLPDVRAADDPGWEAQLAEWRATAERLARDFVAGRAAVDPAERACEHCPLPALCRIEQRSLAATDDSGDSASAAASE